MAIGIIAAGMAGMIFLEERMLANNISYEQVNWAAYAGVELARAKITDSLHVSHQEIPTSLACPDSSRRLEPVLPDTRVQVDIDTSEFKSRGDIKLLVSALKGKASQKILCTLLYDRSPYFTLRAREICFRGVKHPEEGDMVNIDLGSDVIHFPAQIRYEWELCCAEESTSATDSNPDPPMSDKGLRSNNQGQILFSQEECTAMKNKALSAPAQWQYLRAAELEQSGSGQYHLSLGQINKPMVFIDIEPDEILLLSGEPSDFAPAAAEKCPHKQHKHILIVCQGNMAAELNPQSPCWAEQAFIYLSPGSISLQYQLAGECSDSISAYALAGGPIELSCLIGSDNITPVFTFRGSLLAGEDIEVKARFDNPHSHLRRHLIIAAYPGLFEYEPEYYPLLGIGKKGLYKYHDDK